jgi:hypothetical protein
MTDIEKKMLADAGFNWEEVVERADVLADVWGWRAAWLLRVPGEGWDAWLGKYQMWLDDSWRAVAVTPVGLFGDAGKVWKDDFWPKNEDGRVDNLVAERMGWVTSRTSVIETRLAEGAREWCVGWTGKVVRVAKIAEIAGGRITRIIKLPDDRESVLVDGCGWTSVQPLKHNLEAVASFWEEGRSDWKHYYVMRTNLGHRQRQLAKAGLCDPPPQRKAGRPLKNKDE